MQLLSDDFCAWDKVYVLGGSRKAFAFSIVRRLSTLVPMMPQPSVARSQGGKDGITDSPVNQSGTRQTWPSVSSCMHNRQIALSSKCVKLPCDTPWVADWKDVEASCVSEEACVCYTLLSWYCSCHVIGEKYKPELVCGIWQDQIVGKNIGQTFIS